jgi:hypothetical protein
MQQILANRKAFYATSFNNMFFTVTHRLGIVRHPVFVKKQNISGTDLVSTIR